MQSHLCLPLIVANEPGLGAINVQPKDGKISLPVGKDVIAGLHGLAAKLLLEHGYKGAASADLLQFQALLMSLTDDGQLALEPRILQALNDMKGEIRLLREDIRKLSAMDEWRDQTAMDMRYNKRYYSEGNLTIVHLRGKAPKLAGGPRPDLCTVAGYHTLTSAQSREMAEFYGLEDLCDLADTVAAHRKRVHLLLEYVCGNL